ncbi:MAG: DUF2061 domain-containing protein [Crocinitomicaceae bacterium]|jgi:uncharacterized membrane protein
MILDLFKIKSATDPKVSVLKAISWRIIGTIDTIIIAYFFTGQIKVALGIGSFEVVSKMALYFLHERAWIRILKRKH